MDLPWPSHEVQVSSNLHGSCILWICVTPTLSVGLHPSRVAVAFMSGVLGLSSVCSPFAAVSQAVLPGRGGSISSAIWDGQRLGYACCAGPYPTRSRPPGRVWRFKLPGFFPPAIFLLPSSYKSTGICCRGKPVQGCMLWSYQSWWPISVERRAHLQPNDHKKNKAMGTCGSLAFTRE